MILVLFLLKHRLWVQVMSGIVLPHFFFLCRFSLVSGSPVRSADSRSSYWQLVRVRKDISTYIIMQTCPCNILRYFSHGCKKGNFQVKNGDIFLIYLRDSRQEFAKVGVYFPYISCCGFTRF